MSTPNFKLLANALRLGQPPPDPLAAFRVLVEVIQQQESEIADLRQRVSMLTSRLQFTEAKASRVEAATLGEASIRTPTFGPPPAPPPATEQPAAAPAAQASPQIPAMPPIPKEAKPRPQQRAAAIEHQELSPIDESDVTLGTLVVARADIDSVVKNLSENEAPYPLSPPGGHRAAPETSGMPFKPARPLDPTGGTLKGSPKTPSRPPPPGLPAIPAAPKIPGKPAAAPVITTSKAPSVPPPAAPVVRVQPRMPMPRPEPSAPYIAIEDMPMDDTFSSTSENMAVDVEVPSKLPGAANPERASLLDENSFDDSAMTILTRRPHGQGH